MSNRLEELHAECKKYHFKRLIKAVLTLVVLFFVMIGLYLLIGYFFPQNRPTENKRVMSLLKQEIAPQEKYALDISSEDVAEAVAKMQADKPVKQKAVTLKETRPEKVPAPVKKGPVFVNEMPKQTFFTDIDQEKSLDDWIEKYNKKKSYALAIYIAKQYYFESDYKNAGIWAKRANQLDRNKEEAWLYYAKSVYALGDTKKAKRILNIYLQYKDSNKAELLLSEWGEKEK